MSAEGAPVKVAGVIGWPVAHSLSPKLHAHWLRENAVNGAYVPLAVRKEDFSLVVKALSRASFVGVNVTLPHKEAAFALAHDHDDVAVATRSANLLIFRDGRIEARNTDTFGFQASVTDVLGPDAFRGAIAVVLGAGGAARAVVLALDQLGTASIQILNRSRQKAEALVSELTPRTKGRVELLEECGWNNAAVCAAILVNATSAGLGGEIPFALSLDRMPSTSVVCDLVYNPLETELLKQASRRGLRTIDGLGMLMDQAIPSFAAFYGVTPHVTPFLRRELEQALLP